MILLLGTYAWNLGERWTQRERHSAELEIDPMRTGGLFISIIQAEAPIDGDTERCDPGALCIIQIFWVNVR